MDTKQLEEAVLLAVEGLKLDGGWSAEEKNCGDYVKDIAGDAIRAVFSSAAIAAAPAQAARQPLTDEQIDRAISELGLNYLADADETNRAELRNLCHYTHNIK